MHRDDSAMRPSMNTVKLLLVQARRNIVGYRAQEMKSYRTDLTRSWPGEFGKKGAIIRTSSPKVAC